VTSPLRRKKRNQPYLLLENKEYKLVLLFRPVQVAQRKKVYPNTLCCGVIAADGRQEAEGPLRR